MTNDVVVGSLGVILEFSMDVLKHLLSRRLETHWTTFTGSGDTVL